MKEQASTNNQKKKTGIWEVLFAVTFVIILPKLSPLLEGFLPVPKASIVLAGIGGALGVLIGTLIKNNHAIVKTIIYACFVLPAFYLIFNMGSFKTFTPDNARYSVLLSGKVTESIQEENGIELNMAQSKLGSYELLVSDFKFPQKTFSDSERFNVLKGMKEGMIGENEIVEGKNIDYLGHPGFELILKNSENIFIKVKLFFVNNIVYQQIATGDKQVLTNKRVEEFFNSLKIKSL